MFELLVLAFLILVFLKATPSAPRQPRQGPHPDWDNYDWGW